jgi:hypothetical protein
MAIYLPLYFMRVAIVMGVPLRMTGLLFYLGFPPLPSFFGKIVVITGVGGAV